MISLYLQWGKPSCTISATFKCSKWFLSAKCNPIARPDSKKIAVPTETSLHGSPLSQTFSNLYLLHKTYEFLKKFSTKMHDKTAIFRSNSMEIFLTEPSSYRNKGLSSRERAQFTYSTNFSSSSRSFKRGCILKRLQSQAGARTAFLHTSLPSWRIFFSCEPRFKFF